MSLTLLELLQREGGDGEAPLHELCSHLLVATHLSAVDAVDQVAVSRRLHDREGQHVGGGIQVKTVQYRGGQLPHPALLYLQGAETTLQITAQAQAEKNKTFSEFEKQMEKTKEVSAR